jgi:hypothetical protein
MAAKLFEGMLQPYGMAQLMSYSIIDIHHR